MRTFVLRRQAVRAAEDEHRVLDRQAEQQHGQAVDAQAKAAVRRAAVPGDGGHHEEMDRTAAGLERDPRTLSIYFAERMPGYGGVMVEKRRTSICQQVIF